MKRSQKKKKIKTKICKIKFSLGKEKQRGKTRRMN